MEVKDILDITLSDGEIFFLTRENNGIYHRLFDGTSEMVKTFSAPLQYQMWGFRTIFSYKSSLICVPYFNNYIYIWDKETNEEKTISIESPRIQTKRFERHNAYFINAILVDDCLLLVPACYPAFLVLDLNSLETKYLESWIDETEANEELGRSVYYFRKQYAQIGAELFLPMCNKNEILKINTSSWKIQNIDFSSYVSQGFAGISQDNHFLYIAPTIEPRILKYNVLTNDIQLIELKIDTTNHEKCIWGLINDNKGHMLVLLQCCNHLLKMSLESIVFETMEITEDEIIDCTYRTRYYWLKQFSNEIMCYSLACQSVFLIQEKEVKKIKFYCGVNLMKEYIERNGMTVLENPNFLLSDFTNTIRG